MTIITDRDYIMVDSGKELINENSGFNLKTKPDFKEAIQRVYAWFNGEIIDRAPVLFLGHNRFSPISYLKGVQEDGYDFEKWKKEWFNTEKVVDNYVNSIENQGFHAETFPIFWPNLGPDVYSVFYGGDLKFDGATSWSTPSIKTVSDIEALRFSEDNEYFKKIIELTECAIQKSEQRYITGYTDLHPGLDCVLAWRGSEQLCYDIIDAPEMVKEMLKVSSKDFKFIFDFFDNILKKNNQLSVSWMGVPSFGKMHIPSCDFATMMSPGQFNEFALPSILDEVGHVTHNIFHLDGPGVAKNIDVLLEIPEITAIQWVQGVGADEPIMQWVPWIKKIQDAKKSVMVYLKKEELDEFIEALRPEGLFICLAGGEKEYEMLAIDRIKKW